MSHLTPTPVLYHVSSALSSAFVCRIVGLFACGGSWCNVQLSVVVTDVCGGGRKWPNEDD